MKKRKERGDIEKKRRRNLVNFKGKGKRKRIVNKKDLKGTLVSHTFVFVHLWIFNFLVTDAYAELVMI